MKRLRLLTVATLMALTFTACDETAEPVEPPPPPPPVGTISGAVTIDGTGAAGVTVTLSSGATMATGAGGGFSFTGVDAGSHTVSISGYPADATFPSTVQIADITADGQTVILDFAGRYIRASSLVGMVVAEDAMTGDAMTGTGGMPDALNGVTVTLAGAHATGESAVTVNGSFAFTGLRAGAYTLTIGAYPADVEFETPAMTVEVGVGEAGSVAFTGRYIRTSSISGSLMVSGDGLDGVEVTLAGGHARGEHAVSADGGQFAFAGLRAGTYTVMIGNLPGDVNFAVTSKSVTVGVGQAGRVSFSEGSYVRSSSIVGVVATTRRMGRGAYNGDGDVDEDGVGGVDGVRVSLSGEHAAGESAFTGNGGHFAFTALRAGAYTVALSGLPGDVRFETMSADVEVARGQTAVVSDFENGTELFEEGTIGGQLYVDGNENQAYERAVDGRLPLAGATITLEGLGSSATSVDRTTTTDEEGRYGFEGLDAGTYRVWIDSREQVYADRKVRSNGPGSLRIDLREGRSGIVDFPFVITEFEVRVAVVFGHDDEDNESPAEGVGVGLYRNSDGTGLIGDRTRKTDETGVATFALSRDDVDELAASTIVFSRATAPDKTQLGEDPLLTFTLDKNRFDNAPGDDHNLLWTAIELTVGYLEQDGATVPDSRITREGVDFRTRIQFPVIDAADAEDEQPRSVVRTLKRRNDGRVSVEIDLTHDSDSASYGKYVAYDSTLHVWRINFGGTNAANAPAGSVDLSVNDHRGGELDFTGPDGQEYTDDDITLPRVAIEGDHETSDDVQYLEGQVDGSVNEVHLGDFVVSYPYPEIKARVWHETNDVPGYQGPVGRRERATVAPDRLGGNTGVVVISGFPIPGIVLPHDQSVGISFHLEYKGATIAGDEDGDFADGVMDSCDEGIDGNDLGVVTCIAPASAREWRLVATARDLHPGTGDLQNPTNPDFGQPLRYDLPFNRNPTVVLLADGAGDYEIELDDYDVIASVLVEPTSSEFVLDMGNTAFSYKYTNAQLRWIPFNRGGTRLPASLVGPTHPINAQRAPNANAGDVAISGIDVKAIPTEGILGSELVHLATPTAETMTQSGAVFSDLLEGRYAVTVVGENLSGTGIRRSTGRTLEDMRGVQFTRGHPSALVPMAELVVPYTARVVGPGVVLGETTVFQEVEYRGTVKGYVFNNQDDNNVISTSYESLAGVMVVFELDNCLPSGDQQRRVFAADTTHTDAEGGYAFRPWEASVAICYTVAPRGLATQPAARPLFEPGKFVSGTSPQYDFPALGTTATTFAMSLDATTTDTDFEVVYNGGVIEARITGVDGGGPVVMEVTLERCLPPPGAVGGADGTPGSTSTAVAKRSGQFAHVEGCERPSGSRTQRADATGRVVWTGLTEGWYRARTPSRDIKGGATTYVLASETVRIHQLSSSPVTAHVNLALTAN